MTATIHRLFPRPVSATDETLAALVLARRAVQRLGQDADAMDAVADSLERLERTIDELARRIGSVRQEQ